MAAIAESKGTPVGIPKRKHGDTACSGEGVRRYGGRWNSQGVAVLYTAGGISLAMLEMLVQLDVRVVLFHHLMLEARLDESLIESVTAKELPQGWDTSPPPSEAKRLGDRWIAEARTVALKAPNAVVPTEVTYLLNPHRADFRRIEICDSEPLARDPRLLK